MEKTKIKEEVRELWKLCFPEDTEAFMDLYFSLRYTDDINSCIISDDRVVSALQRIPYPMKYMDKVINTSYISGACTHPDYRSGGLMRRLLAEAHRRMYADGILLSSLIPASHSLKDYYSKSGYIECYQQSVELLTGSEQPVDNYNISLIINKIDLCITPDKAISGFYYQQLSTGKACILHTPRDLFVVMSDHKLSGGDMWVGEAAESGKIEALAFTVIDTDGRLIIKELVCSSLNICNEMIRLLYRHYQVLQAEVVIFPYSVCKETDKACVLDFGMARVINVLQMLSVYSSYLFGDRNDNTSGINPDALETLYLISGDTSVSRESDKLFIEVYGDDAIDSNNGYYVISPAGCEKTDCASFLKAGHICADLKSSYIRLSISQLGQLLLKDFRPYMNMMLN